jgi:hypothetical protein
LGHFQSPHLCSPGEVPEAEIQTETLPGKHYETTLALRQSINVHVYRAALLQLITSLPNRAAAFSLRVYLACANMAARNEDFS